MEFEQQVFGTTYTKQIPKSKPSVAKKEPKKVTLAYKKQSQQHEQQSISAFFQKQAREEAMKQKMGSQASLKIRSRTNTRDTNYENSATGLRIPKKIEINLKMCLSGFPIICKPCYQVTPKKNCLACHGSQQIHGRNNIIKFFQFLLQYKLGLKSSYIPNFETSKSQKIQTFSKCYRASQSSNYNPRKTIKEIQEENKEKWSQIHEGYACDECMKCPIEGTRYHCTHSQCGNDYDMCQQCFTRKNHRHPDNLEQIKFCKKQQKYLSLVSNLRNSTKPINSRNTVNIYKSSLN